LTTAFGTIIRCPQVLALLAALSVLAASCGGGSEEKTVRGLLTDVQGRAIAEVETLTIQEEGTGKVWTFYAQGDVGFTPSHLRQHMLRGEPVTVRYREQPDRLLVIRLTD